MFSRFTDLFKAEIESPLGKMVAVATVEKLVLLDFCDKKCVENVVWGKPEPILSIENELKRYFEGTLRTFKTSIEISGTPFQKTVWGELQKIPFGQTLSYSALAAQVGNLDACRAVAGANSRNRFSILIPCHRVKNKDGTLGGYSGGIERKEWLLRHEKSCGK